MVAIRSRRSWRELARAKAQYVKERVRVQNRIEGHLEEMRIKLSGVISDLLGASGRRIPAAPARGEVGAAPVTARRDIGDALRTPAIASVQGAAMRIDGKQGFWAGTNYYPSSSWWDWLWRDFRPLEAAQDFSSMRRLGPLRRTARFRAAARRMSSCRQAS